jgi:hypothetical protein
MNTNKQEATSRLDSTEMSELVNENLRRERFRVATTTNSEQLREFLQHCTRRGSPYQAGTDLFPRLKQLAKYCGCDTSTIYRISTGEQRSMKSSVADVLLLIAGISPAPTVRSPGEVVKERRRRLANADAWVDRDPRTRGNIVDNLLKGIRTRERRRDRKRNKLQMKQKV